MLSSISFSRGPSQPRNQTHVTYVCCVGKWVLYHQRPLALRVRGSSLGAFLVGQVPLSGARPWRLPAHLVPATVSSPCSPLYLSGPAHSLSPRTETPLYGVKHPLPGPLSRLPQGEAISLYSDFPSSIFCPLPPPCGCIVGHCLPQIFS